MKNLFALFLLFFPIVQKAQAQVGTLRGVVIDPSTKEPVIGATVAIDNILNYTTTTEVDGSYVIENIPVGKHTIEVQYISYKKFTNENLIINTGENTLNIDLQADTKTIKEVEIKANMKKETISTLLKLQKNSLTIGDGVSSEAIKKSPDRTTADAIKRISGVSIQSNKYAIIRGLTDRYNSALLNGFILPSTEADRKVFSFDIIPASMIDNLVAIKTASPNLTSDFAGGIIQINTKDIPEENTWQFSLGTGYNSLATFKEHLFASSSSADIIGFGANSRDLNNVLVTSEEFKLKTKAEKIEQAKLLDNDWGLTQKKTFAPNANFQIVKTIAIDSSENYKWGLIAGLTYNNSNSFVNSTRNDFDAVKFQTYSYDDKIYTNNVQWGFLMNTGLKTKKSKYVLRSLFTTTAEQFTDQRTGTNFEQLQSINYYIDQYNENHLSNISFSGENETGNNKFKFSYGLAYNNFQNKMPNLRKLYYYQNIDDIDDPTMSAYVSPGSGDADRSGIINSEMNEDAYTVNAGTDYSYKWLGEKQKVLIGYQGQFKNRVFDARVFGMSIFSLASFNWQNLEKSPDMIFSPENLSTTGFFLDEITNKSDHYDASSSYHAAYISSENKYKELLKWNVGLRVEMFNQNLNSFNYSNEEVNVDQTNLFYLPSMNFVYELKKDMNIRLSASQTTARPEFRELAPFSFYDFAIASNIQGNDKLTPSVISNFDFRYEYYPTSSQMISFSLFYKSFKDPIEQTVSALGAGTRLRSFANVAGAENYGAEVEVRKNFEFLDELLSLNKMKNLSFMLNLAYIYSKVDLSNVATSSAKERPLQGQSPYVINTGLMYNHKKSDLSISVLYNIVGNRIMEVGTQGYNDVVEKHRGVLDFTVSKKIVKNLNFKLTARNLFQRNIIFFQDNDTNLKYDESIDNLIQKINTPLVLGLSFSYKF